MTITIQPPDPSSRVVDQARRIDTVWDRFLRNLWSVVNSHDTRLEELDDNGALKEQPWRATYYIGTAADGTYTIPKGTVDGSINAVVAYIESGSCTLEVQVADTTLSDNPTLSLTADTTVDEFFAFPTALDEDIQIIITNNSSATKLAVTLVGTQIFISANELEE